MLGTFSSSSSSLPKRDNSKNNMFGSVEDLQDYSLGLRNHNLTISLVQAKKDWEVLQASFRANTHARFVYQTTLARIVAHVQDFSDCEQLTQDVLTWTGECESVHFVLPGSSGHGSIASAGSEELTHHSKDNNGTSKPIPSGQSQQQQQQPPTQRNSLRGNNGNNRTPIIDYNDVEPFVDTSTTPSWITAGGHHASLQEQNDALVKEVAKWKNSMARIRICNKREASELLTHQKTLRKVVARIQASSHFSRKEDVIQWYEQCQQEAERCGSFSERDAAKYCNRCHSKLSDDNDSSEELELEIEKEDAAAESGQVTIPVAGDSLPEDRPETPTTTALEASHSINSSESDENPANGTSSNDKEVAAKRKAKAAAIAAANVEDPPDRIQPKATNLKGSSVNQLKPGMVATTANASAGTKTTATAASATAASGCGPICSIM